MNKRGASHPLAIAVTAVALGTVVFMTSRPQADHALEAYAGKPQVSFATVSAIVQTRCVTCHAVKPTSPMFPAPPNGIVLETPDAIAALGDRIFVRAVTTKTMPLGNITGMQDDERELLGAWIAQGKDVHASGPAVEVKAVDAGTSGSGAAVTPEALAEHRWKNLCVTCHGVNGDGQSPTAAALTVKPRNFTDAAWQKATPDDAIRKIIVEGGVAVGKSPTMPPNPDLKEKPEVVDALLKIVRGYAK